MDRNEIYKAFFDQMNEAVEWMLQEENSRSAVAYMDGAATLAARLIEQLEPAVMVKHLTKEEAAEFSAEWQKAVIEA